MNIWRVVADDLFYWSKTLLTMPVKVDSQGRIDEREGRLIAMGATQVMRNAADLHDVHQVTISNAARGATYKAEWEQACRNLEAISVGTKKQLELVL